MALGSTRITLFFVSAVSLVDYEPRVFCVLQSKDKSLIFLARKKSGKRD
jgi:hypothetical protein